MGRKEQEKKAKRALAATNPEPKRLAAGSGNPASSVSSGGVEAAPESVRVATPNTATGSTKSVRVAKPNAANVPRRRRMWL